MLTFALSAYPLSTDYPVHAAMYCMLQLWYACSQSISFGRGPGNSSSSSDSQAGNSSNNSSSSGSSLTAQPLFDLGMPKDEVKARLAPIPVYTVANPKNEFVLVAGEVSRLRAEAAVLDGHSCRNVTAHHACGSASSAAVKGTRSLLQ